MVPSAFTRPGRAAADAERQGGPQGAAGARAASGSERRTRFVAPRTPVEELLAAIWAEVLGRRAGRRPRQLLRARRPLAAGHAGRLARARGFPGGAAAAQPVRGAHRRRARRADRGGSPRRAGPDGPAARYRAPRDAQLPLSFAQQRLWFLDQLEPDSSRLQHPAALRLSGPLDVDGARSGASTELVRRHEALRTTFAAVDGEPVQVIAPRAATRRCRVDRPERAAASRARGRGAAARAEEARRPFDLARGPLLRARCCAWPRASTCCC